MKSSSGQKPVRDWHCGGLRIYTRGRTFHVGGTLRAGTRSREIRKSLNLAAIKANVEEAERATQNLIAQVRAELGGRISHKSVATLVDERFQSHTGKTDRAILKEFTAKFTTRILFEIPPEEIVAYVDDRERGNKAESRERHLNGICAFLNRQVKAGQYPRLPPFQRDPKARNPTTRKRRDVRQFRPDLVQALIDAAHPTIGIQLHVEFVSGARVSSVLHGATLGNLDMEGMTLTFSKTKNGADVTVALPETIRQPMEQYLAWRMRQVRDGKIGPGSDQPLFLTYKGVPYTPNGGAWGTQNKTGFNAAKRRAIAAVAALYDKAIAAISAAGDRAEVERLQRLQADDVALLKKITQHWLRHKFATDIARYDLVAAKKQGGWKDIRSVYGYLIDDAEYQRVLIEKRGSPRPRKASGDE